MCVVFWVWSMRSGAQRAVPLPGNGLGKWPIPHSDWPELARSALPPPRPPDQLSELLPHRATSPHRSSFAACAFDARQQATHPRDDSPDLTSKRIAAHQIYIPSRFSCTVRTSQRGGERGPVAKASAPADRAGYRQHGRRSDARAAEQVERERERDTKCALRVG